MILGEVKHSNDKTKPARKPKIKSSNCRVEAVLCENYTGKLLCARKTVLHRKRGDEKDLSRKQRKKQESVRFEICAA